MEELRHAATSTKQVRAHRECWPKVLLSCGDRGSTLHGTGEMMAAHEEWHLLVRIYT